MQQPKAILCVTGSELTRGETEDRNGPFMAAHLSSLGVSVASVLLLPDDAERLGQAFRESMERADIVVSSGGLGPTRDDLTVRVLADVLGRKVIVDPEAERRMRQRALARWGTLERIPANFFKQAEVVEGSTVLLNPVGLAPGCLVETERGILVVLPGVPREMRAMFRDLVIPAVIERFHPQAPRIFRAKVLNHPESIAESRIQALQIDYSKVEYGISARPGELLLRFIARGLEDHGYIDTVRQRLEVEFGDDLFSLPEGLFDPEGGEIQVELSGYVHKLLMRSGQTVATAESCTGGLVAKLLTDHPGSSCYFRGSAVAYDDAVKGELLGVSDSALSEHGAVSEPVCQAMTVAAQRLFHAHYGIGITGIAGPGGGSEEKPVGLVYIGLACPKHDNSGETPRVKVETHRFIGDRPLVRQQTAVRALDLLRRELKPRLRG